MSMLTNWKDKLTDKKAERTVLERQLAEKEESAEVYTQILDTRKNAHQTIQAAAQLTQAALQEQLGSVVSMALTAVFDDPYDFVVEFVMKRNSTECELWLERGGERCKPLDDTGYGAVDIVSTALRLSYWAAGDSRPIIMMDEPCKNLSRKYHSLAAAMFSQMCQQLDLQIIMVTHIPDFREGADNLFMIKMDRKGVSHLTKSQGE